MNGVSVPGMDQPQLQTWLDAAPRGLGFLVTGGSGRRRRPDATGHRRDIGPIYAVYTRRGPRSNPAGNEMTKIGLWIELVVGMGFVVGLGLGSLTGQRTVSSVLMIVLQIIVTPILAATAIPYFLNGQRLVVGLALDQLRPAGLASGAAGRGGPGRALFGGRASSASRRCPPGR